MRRIVPVLVLVLAGCNGGSNHSLAVTGQIEGISVDVGSKIGGRVAEVLVAEGDSVMAGQVLIRIESEEMEAQVAAAEAKLGQAQAVVEKLERGARPEEIRRAQAAAQRALEQYKMAEDGARDQEIRAAAAAVDAARAQLAQAADDRERLDPLFAEGAVSERARDQALRAFEAAQAQYQSTLEQFDLLEEGTRAEQVQMARAAYDEASAFKEQVETGPRQEDLAQAYALRDVAKANLRFAEAQLREMAVTAPRDGIVEALDIYPGDLVKPGALVRITDPAELEIVVYVSAGLLGHIRLGQQVRLTTDSHGPDEAFEGEIVYIASQGEYTPRNLQTQEERVQQMFGVKLRLSSAEGRLRAGMTATAHFDAVPGNA